MEPVVPSKSCTKCGLEKALSEFSPRANRNSLQSRCKLCCAESARLNWRQKAADPNFRADRVRKQRWAYKIARKRRKCGDCGIYVEDQKVYCPDCREKRRANEMERRLRDRESFKVCAICGEPTPERRRKLCVACTKTPERMRERQRAYDARLRQRVFEAYGGPICACCGERERSFLTMDHIEGDGNTHRRSISSNGTASAAKIYTWLQKNNYPPGFQVLCYNCNCGKFRNGGICPHKQQRKSLT